jgi:hypothetical protein
MTAERWGGMCTVWAEQTAKPIHALVKKARVLCNTIALH